MPDIEIAADSDAAAANARRILDFFAAVLGPAHDTAAVMDFLAADFVDHDAASGDSGRHGVRAKLEGLWALLPDGHYVPLQAVAAGDLVTVRSTLVARAVSVAFADIYRLADAKIIEHWHVTDAGELVRQLEARA